MTITARTLERIAAAKADGAIYNVDYTDLKSTVNRELEKGYHAAVSELYLDIPFGSDNRRDVPNGVDDLYGFSQTPQCHTLNAREKFLAKLEKGPNADHFLVKAARAYLDSVRPAIEDMVEIKSTVIKGRKPSTTPRKTPERTLENTGTCAVCGQNVKRDKAGRMVDHGFRIHWNARQGRCPGYGYDPIEVSPKGAESYLILVRSTVEVAEEQLRDLEAMPVEERGPKWPSQKWNAESTLRHASHDVRKFEKIVAEWKPATLPDGTKPDAK